jgi:hypothetical protein
MHAALLTMILSLGADQSAPPVAAHSIMGNSSLANSSQLKSGQSAANSGLASNPVSFNDGQAGAPPYRYDPPRDPQETDGWLQSYVNNFRAWWSPMPQTCYSPHFGCYPGNGRDIYRYPAFHGYYYRQAYNYRPLFEYPWQANPHEPVPLEIRQRLAESRLMESALGAGPSLPDQAPEVIPTPPQPTKTVHGAAQHQGI